MSVRLSTWNNYISTGELCLKCYVANFYWLLSKYQNIFQNSIKLLTRKKLNTLFILSNHLQLKYKKTIVGVKIKQKTRLILNLLLRYWESLWCVFHTSWGRTFKLVAVSYSLFLNNNLKPMDMIHVVEAPPPHSVSNYVIFYVLPVALLFLTQTTIFLCLFHRA